MDPQTFGPQNQSIKRRLRRLMLHHVLITEAIAEAQKSDEIANVDNTRARSLNVSKMTRSGLPRISEQTSSSTKRGPEKIIPA